MQKIFLLSLSLLFTGIIKGQVNVKSLDYNKTKLEEKYFLIPQTQKNIQQEEETIFTLPFLQLDSIITGNSNTDSSFYTNQTKKQFIYDSISGHIIQEISFNWDSITNIWVNSTKKTFVHIGNNLKSEENSVWDTNTLSWLAKNKHDYSYALNGEIDSNLFFTWDTISLNWVGANSDIYNFDINNNLVNYTREIWDTISNAWIPEYKNDYVYDINNNRTLNTRFTWDTLVDQWVNVYKIENTYDLNNNVTLTYGYYWNISAWQNDLKFSLSYDINNNQISDTTFVWNSGSLTWDYSSLGLNSYDGNNNLTSYIYNNWNSGTLVWIPSDKYDYTYDISDNQTSETYSYWDVTNSIWIPLVKSAAQDFFNSFANETSNFIWDNNLLQWIPDDKTKRTYNNSVLFSDIILPFFCEEDLFHHELTTSGNYNWNNGNLNWAINNLSTYYYSNTAIGINELPTKSLATAFPNPTTDVINFKLPKEEVNYTIDVFNCSGAKVKSLSNSSKINVSSLNSGLYIYTITSKNNVYKGKFVKE